jgi:hypothetical protein
MKDVNREIDSTPAGSTQRYQVANADQSTIRICDVPDGTSVGEVLRKADRLAFWYENTTTRSTTVAWDLINGAPSGRIAGQISPAPTPKR